MARKSERLQPPEPTRANRAPRSGVWFGAARRIARRLWQSVRAPRRSYGTPYALYHEAKNTYHFTHCPSGPVLIVFSSRTLAKNFALAGELRGFLPAPMGPREFREELPDLIARGAVGLVVDPRMYRERAPVYPFVDGRPWSPRRLLATAPAGS